MEKRDATTDQLINELRQLRQRVSELKADKALLESGQMMASIMAASPVAIVCTEGSLIKWVNRTWLEMFGYEDEQEFVSQPTSIMHPSQEEYERVRCSLYDNVERGAVSQTDALLKKRDGSLFHANIRISLLDQVDPSRGVISAIADISERIAAEQALEDSSEKYRLVLEKVHDGIVVAQDGMIRFANPRVLKIVGYNEEEILSEPITKFIHPDDTQMVLDRHYRRQQGEAPPSRYSFRIVRKDRSIRWVEIDSGMAHWEDKPAVLFCMTDITERKRAEDAVHESLFRYGTISSLTSDIAYSCTKSVGGAYSIDWLTEATERITGYSADEIKALKCWRAIVMREDLPVFDENIIGVPAGTSKFCELRLRHKDGKTIWVSSLARCVADQESPNRSRLFGGFVDITERKQMEAQLRESEQLYRNFFETSRDSVFITGIDGTIVDFNVAGSELLGYAPSDRDRLRHMNVSSLYADPDQRDTHVRIITEKGFSKDYPVDFRKTDGSIINTLVTTVCRKDHQGAVIGFQGTIRDITDLKRAEQEREKLQTQLFHSQKMEAIGTLAGGIAHDFNNILQVIQGYSDLILMSAQEKDASRRPAEKILAASKRGADLVRNLMMFSRKIQPKLREISLNDEVVEIHKLLTRVIPKGVKIDLKLNGELCPVEADASQIGQLLMNLAVNGRDAMPDGGTLCIETSNAWLYDDYCADLADVVPGAYVLLAVSDTGVGMKKDVLSHVFEPFFTTKEVGRGTGLGLSTVHGIVKQHKGHITCDSEVGKGTTFKVYLPGIEHKPVGGDK